MLFVFAYAALPCKLYDPGGQPEMDNYLQNQFLFVYSQKQLSSKATQH